VTFPVLNTEPDDVWIVITDDAGDNVLIVFSDGPWTVTKFKCIILGALVFHWHIYNILLRSGTPSASIKTSIDFCISL
jgi:hypothetical protein